MFVTDTRDLKKLMENFKKSPKMFGRAASVVINNLAFGTRTQVILDFDRYMIMRDPRFVAGRIKIQKSRPRTNINQIISTVGSVADKPRFSGWLEQETGRKTKKKRTFGLGARKGSKKRRASPRARMKEKFLGPEDVNLKNVDGDSERASAWLAYVQEKKYRKPFRLHGHKTIKPGLFRIVGKKLVRLQHFDRRRKAQPRRAKWLRGARDSYLRNVDIQRLWMQAYKRVVKWK